MKTSMASNETISIHSATDYICSKGIEAEGGFSILKLHKILFYVQAWHLALYGRRLFDERFEAWVHGPVCRSVYSRFHGSSMYSLITAEMIGNYPPLKNALALEHIDNVLDVYGGMSGSQLEELTHREEPWLRTRGKLEPLARCEDAIDESLMQTYYKKVLEASA